MRIGGFVAQALTVGLGLALCGKLFPPVGSFLASMVTQVWLPWTRGATALRAAFDLLAALPLPAAIGSVLVCWGALGVCIQIYEWLASLPKHEKVEMLFGIALAVVGIAWLLAIPFAVLFR